MSRRINARGLGLIHRFEGCRLRAYPDPGTGGEPFTIGWGHTGDGITLQTIWTQAECDRQLLRDLRKFEAGVEQLAPAGLTSNEFSALVSLAYNIGLRALEGSTLLRKLKAGDRAGAAEEFTRWSRAAGRVLPGLLKRRIAERELFLAPDA